MKGTKLVGLIVVLVLIGGVIAAKSAVRKPAVSDDQVQSGAVCPTPVAQPPAADKAVTAPAKEPAPTAQKAAKPAAGKALPTMLELGSVGCKPCTYMAPIIDALTEELKGKVTVQFHDVNDNPAMADKYKVQVIPTQVFFDASGKELFRHVGVFEKEEILAKMKELKMLAG